MRPLIAVLALLLAGCAGTAAPVDPSQFVKPLAILMMPPDPQMPLPPEDCEEDPACRAKAYYAPHRLQCGGYRDGQIGLQAYVSSLHGVTPVQWPAEVSRP